MVEHVEKVREITSQEGDTVATRREVRTADVADTRDTAPSFMARLVSLLSTILLSLLAIRFVLSLLGANQANAFANLIYTITHPFVAPFFGLFNYQTQYGVARLEVATLVAMLVYALLAYALKRIFLLPKRSHA